MEAVVKKKKSVLRRERKEQQKLDNAKGAAIAKLKNVPTSTRKMRLVADLVRGLNVNHALSILKFQSKVGAQSIEKLLLSAIANWQAKNEDVRLEDADLYIKDIHVDGGRILKRLRPAPQGRAHRIRKRSNHITMVIDSMNLPFSNEVTEVTEEVKEDQKELKSASKTKKNNKE
ncbi:50S ribosomal protein L22 [Cytophagaceae bacterium ABcell3]|nr:50S ribosomal protein L22 [Cytophagaceae bacterium ABcell3]